MSNDLFGDSIALHSVRQRPINQSAYNAIARRLNEEAGFVKKYKPHMTEAEIGTAMDMDSADVPLFDQKGKEAAASLNAQTEYDKARSEAVQERRKAMLAELSRGWLKVNHFVEAFGINRSTVSKDLRAMKDAGQIEQQNRREGAHATVAYYRAVQT